MARSIISIIIFVILIVILVGAGILLYRFLVSYSSSTVAVLTINDDQKFTAYQLNLENDKPFRVKNDDDAKQVLKKQDDNSTFVEVDANSTSRELTTPDNSRLKLYIASNKDQVATIITGDANVGGDGSEGSSSDTSSTDNSSSNSTNNSSNNSSSTSTNKDSSGAVKAADTQNSQPLPNTGPENFLYAPLAALLGLIIYRYSNRVLRRSTR